MPVAVTFNAAPSVSRRWRASIVITGLGGSDDLGPLFIFIGSKPTDGAPTVPDDLTQAIDVAPLAKCQWNTVTTIVRVGAEGRVYRNQVIDPGDLSGLLVGGRVWVGITDSEDTADPFLAVAGPRRATV